MLTIAGNFHVDGYTIFRDLARRDDRWVQTTVFYAIADRPRLARDAQGDPAFDFLRYRRAPGTPDGPGGVVTLTIALGLPEDRAALTRAIAAAVGNIAPDDITFGALPLTGGRVSLAFAGETTGGDFTRAIGGIGPARLTGHERATFIVDLTADGAALLQEAIAAGRDLFHARYTLDLVHILGDIELRVWCDTRGAHRAASARAAAGSVSPATLRDALVGEHLAGYEITNVDSVDAEHQKQLDELGRTLLEQILAEAFIAADGQMQPWSEQLPALVNRSYRDSVPMTTPMGIEDILALPDALPESHVRSITLDGGRANILDLTLLCTFGDADDLVDTVKATVRYQRQGAPDQTECLLTRGTPTARVRTDFPTPSDRSYQIEALVFYRGDPVPARLLYPASTASVAVLDLDGLGVLQVAIALGDVPFDRVRQASVELLHEPTGGSAAFLLDREHAAGVWRHVIRDGPRAWRARVTWVLQDDTRVTEPWRESTAASLTLHAPDAIRTVSRVLLVSGEPFDGVAQIALQLRASADDPSPAHRLFTAAGQQQDWTAPRLPGEPLAYDVQETVVHADGLVVTGEWRREDAPVLLVRDRGRFSVRILTRLLPFGPELPLALLVLEPLDGSDPAGDRVTLPLRDGRELMWNFRVQSGDRHRYRYELILIARSGQRTSVPWQEADGELLVLRPPG